MTERTLSGGGGPAGSDNKVIALVSAAHLVSHVYLLVLPPLFPLIRADLGVSYTDLGIALAAFGLVSTVLQAPAGVLVDRLSPYAALVVGLLLSAAAMVGVALFQPFWAFVAMFGLLGVGNTAYHPANYSLLAQHVAPKRMAHAYSVHTFAGMLGSAVTPALLLLLAAAWGWRGAYLVTGVLGVLCAGLLVLNRRSLQPVRSRSSPLHAAVARPSWRIVLAPAIVLNLLMFTALALAHGSLQNYSVVALQALHGTPLSVANLGLTAFLAMAAAGVLMGGLVAVWIPNPTAVALLGTGLAGLSGPLLALYDWGPAMLVLIMAFAGFCTGVIMPSRDLLVRSVTPPGAFGTVFGFVSIGFNVSAILGPPALGWLMDHGHPRAVLLSVAVFSLLAGAAVLAGRPRLR